MQTTILYSNGLYWVRAEKFGTGRFKPKSAGYGVYKNRITHSFLVASIGWGGQKGLERAIAEADKRAAGDK